MAFNRACRLLTLSFSPSLQHVAQLPSHGSSVTCLTFPVKRSHQRISVLFFCSQSSPKFCFQVTTLCHPAPPNPSSDLVDSGGNHEVVLEQRTTPEPKTSFSYLLVPSVHSQQAVSLLPDFTSGDPCRPGAPFLVMRSIPSPQSGSHQNVSPHTTTASQ